MQQAEIALARQTILLCFSVPHHSTEKWYRVTELNVSLIWIKWASQSTYCSTAKFSLSVLHFMPSSGTGNSPVFQILNIEAPKMGASPQTPKLRGAARHYAVHQVEPHIIFMATKKQERMAICGVQLWGWLNNWGLYVILMSWKRDLLWSTDRDLATLARLVDLASFSSF